MRKKIVLLVMVCCFIGCSKSDPAYTAPSPPPSDPGTTQPDPDVVDEPDNPCKKLPAWDATWVAKESELIAEFNQRQTKQIVCGDSGIYGPHNPVATNEVLRKVAREHSCDMAMRDFLTNHNPDNEYPNQRVDETSYKYVALTQAVAAGPAVPEIIDGWVEDPRHCVQFFETEYQEVGVGYYYDPDSSLKHYWTILLGNPDPEG